MPPQTSKQDNNSLPPGFSGSPKQELDPLSDEALGKDDSQDSITAFKSKWNTLTRQQKDEAINKLSAQEQSQLYDTLRGGKGQEDIVRAPAQFTSNTLGNILSGRAEYDPWVQEKMSKLAYWGIEHLPMAGGIAGGLAGGAVGGAINPAGGEGVGAVVGSGVGGAAGEGARQGIEHLAGWDQYDEPITPGQRVKEMAGAGIDQLIGELVGQGLGKVMRPTLNRAIKKLYYAGGLEHGDPMEEGMVESIFPELQKFERLNPVKDNKSLVKLVQETKKDIGQQVDILYAKPVQQGGRTVMFGHASANTQPLVDAVDKLIKKYSLNADLHGPELRMLKTLRTKAAKPRTFSQLADWRIEINNRLRGFYAEHAGGNQQALLMSRPDLLAEKDVADAIRDVSYPEMDRAAGFPKGTTAALQQKRGAAIALEEQAISHRANLLTKSKQVGGASPLQRGNMSGYVTSRGKFGAGIHRVTSVLHAPDVLKDADKRAASAFEHTWPTKVGKRAGTPAGMAVMSVPPRMAAAGVRHAVSGPAPGGKPDHIYAYTATDKNTGHKIGSDDLQNWKDLITGEPVE